jgi:hypothetical protein
MSNSFQETLPRQCIRIEDRSIYDGWCAELFLNTGELVWRDAWFVDRLSDKQKQDFEFKWKKAFLTPK